MNDRRLLRWAVYYGLAVAAAVVLFIAVQPPPETVQRIWTPRFRDLPPTPGVGDAAAYLAQELRQPRGQRLLDLIVPSESGAVWLSLAVALAVAVFSKQRSGRALDLVLLLLPGILLFHSLGLLDRIFFFPPYVTLLEAVFSGVVAVSLALAGRALWLAYRPRTVAWQPNLTGPPLVALAVFLVSLNVLIALARPPDDSGYFVNLGAQRFRERGLLPYGDPILHGTAGAAYGPLLYVAHVPFQWLLEPPGLNPDSPDTPELGDQSRYLAPSPLSTQACALAFHLLGVAALWLAARRLAGDRVAWGLVALYCGSAAVLGIGGDVDMVAGISFVSHIAPASMVLAAFACLPRPLWSGMLLAAAAGVGFYPALLVPAWVGHYWGDRRSVWRFLAGFTLVGALTAMFVLALSRAAPDLTVLGTFFRDTLGHHTDPLRYGRSPFGFWGQRGGIRAWLMEPLVGSSGLASPAYVLLIATAVAAFFLTRRRPAASLALASAAVAIGFSIVKIHATGTYLAWSYPLLLIGHFAWPPGERGGPD